MNDNLHSDAPVGLSPADIYFVLFRHKWKIIILSLAGLIVAGYFYFTHKPPYQSEAKLLIRYVTDKRDVNPMENNNARITSEDLGKNILGSEVEILASLDLAAEVATNVGAAKILAAVGGGDDPLRAASVIQNGLHITISGESSVIDVIFRHPDPDVVRPVLTELINDYFDKHELVHSDVGVSDDFLNVEKTQLAMQIAATDDELRVIKTNAGIVSIADSQKSYSAEIERIRQELFEANEQLAENQVKSHATSSADSAGQNNSPPPVVSQEVLDEFRSANAHLNFLQKREADYLYTRGYTDQNTLVIEVRQEIADAVKKLKDLQTKYPGVAETLAATSSGTNSVETWSSLPMRINILKQELAEVQGEAANLEGVNNKIADLERRKQLMVANYQYLANSLEQDRIDQAMGPGRVSNIKPIQHPSPPFKDYRKFYKTILGMILGGACAGIGWAFLIEYYFDRSIKRAVEIQTKLKIPFFLSIPDFNHAPRRRLGAHAQRQLAYATDGEKSFPLEVQNDSHNGNGHAVTKLEIPPWEVDHRLDAHYDALRDRLVAYFESINLTRKPKLVAVTATDNGAGVSTIAAGLAASLSETGDGRVLLVDMNQEHGAAQQFFQGKPICKLDDALIQEKREGALVQENLYVVSEGTVSDRLPRVLPKRFASLVPKLKASDYDYIIFDMPPVSPTSITTRLAGFMDNVMLVIESEKNDQHVVQQAHALLLQSKANVTAVLNKTRHYIPARLHQDFLSDI